MRSCKHSPVQWFQDYFCTSTHTIRSWWYIVHSVPVGGHLNFVATGHQGSLPTCSWWFLKISWPVILSCQISKSCHKVHNSDKFLPSCRWNCLPSVLWRCWLGVRKGIRPVKNLTDEVLAWSKVQIACIWFSWYYCHLIMSASAKYRMVYSSGTDSPG